MQFSPSPQITESLLLISFLVCVNFIVNHLVEYSCSTQSMMAKYAIAKHGFTLAAVFFMLVLFSRYNTIPPYLLVILTFVMYIVFLLLMRCDPYFLIAFVIVMVIVFYIEAEKNYRVNTKTMTDGEKQKWSKFQLALQGLSLVIVIIGVVVYIGQESREFKRDWNWSKFWFGDGECDKDGVPVVKPFHKDFHDGVKRISKSAKAR